MSSSCSMRMCCCLQESSAFTGAKIGGKNEAGEVVWLLCCLAGRGNGGWHAFVRIRERIRNPGGSLFSVAGNTKTAKTANKVWAITHTNKPLSLYIFSVSGWCWIDDDATWPSTATAIRSFSLSNTRLFFSSHIRNFGGGLINETPGLIHRDLWGCARVSSNQVGTRIIIKHHKNY